MRCESLKAKPPHISPLGYSIFPKRTKPEFMCWSSMRGCAIFASLSYGMHSKGTTATSTKFSRKNCRLFLAGSFIWENWKEKSCLAAVFISHSLIVAFRKTFRILLMPVNSETQNRQSTTLARPRKKSSLPKDCLPVRGVQKKLLFKQFYASFLFGGKTKSFSARCRAAHKTPGIQRIFHTRGCVQLRLSAAARIRKKEATKKLSNPGRRTEKLDRFCLRTVMIV